MSIRPVMCKCEAGGPALTNRVGRVHCRDLDWYLKHTQLAEDWAACESFSSFPGEENIFSLRSFQLAPSGVSLGDKSKMTPFILAFQCSHSQDFCCAGLLRFPKWKPEISQVHFVHV